MSESEQIREAIRHWLASREWPVRESGRERPKPEV
jgi:Arc/MetJ-type ribon-helix-helix transcriptional regulator